MPTIISHFGGTNNIFADCTLESIFPVEKFNKIFLCFTLYQIIAPFWEVGTRALFSIAPFKVIALIFFAS